MTKTVVLFGSYAPSLINFRGSLIKAMTESGHKVACLAPDFDEQTAVKLRELKAEAMPVSLARSGINPFEDIKSFRSIRAALRAIKPDVLIPYTIKPVIWGSLAAHAENVPRIVPMITGLGYAFTTGASPTRLVSLVIASLLYRLALGKADLVLFQNPDDLSLFRSRHLLPRSVPAEIIAGSGVDIEHFAKKSVPSETSFLMISRLLKNKGVREFAAAAKLIKQRHPSVRIKLAGYLDASADSIDQPTLDGMISDGIEFLGKLTDVRQTIEDAAVYVLPSYREGTPRSSLEAMSIGRAIVTTDVPGCRETVQDGVNGFLVPPRDPTALAAAMERFVDDPGLVKRMGEASRHIAESKYDVRRVNDEVMRYAGLTTD